MVEIMKKCAVCKEEHPETNYTKNRSMKDGLQIQCKKCTKSYNDRANSTRNEFARRHYKTPHDKCVYAFKDGNEIVYIGESVVTSYRIWEHYVQGGSKSKSFCKHLNSLERKKRYRWNILWHGDSDEDRKHQEKCLIQLHQPKFNKEKFENYGA